ncbi:hypothetical protein ACFL29_01690, partial [Patescibacteria group bacterium]
IKQGETGKQIKRKTQELEKEAIKEGEAEKEAVERGRIERRTKELEEEAIEGKPEGDIPIVEAPPKKPKPKKQPVKIKKEKAKESEFGDYPADEGNLDLTKNIDTPTHKKLDLSDADEPLDEPSKKPEGLKKPSTLKEALKDKKKSKKLSTDEEEAPEIITGVERPDLQKPKAEGGMIKIPGIESEEESPEILVKDAISSSKKNLEKEKAEELATEEAQEKAGAEEIRASLKDIKDIKDERRKSKTLDAVPKEVKEPELDMVSPEIAGGESEGDTAKSAGKEDIEAEWQAREEEVLAEFDATKDIKIPPKLKDPEKFSRVKRNTAEATTEELKKRRKTALTQEINQLYNHGIIKFTSDKFFRDQAIIKGYEEAMKALDTKLSRLNVSRKLKYDVKKGKITRLWQKFKINRKADPEELEKFKEWQDAYYRTKKVHEKLEKSFKKMEEQINEVLERGNIAVIAVKGVGARIRKRR